MRFELRMTNKGLDVHPWVEVEESPNVFNGADALEYGIRLADKFNEGHPLKRMCLSARILGPSDKVPHIWHKTNLVTIKQGGRLFDTAECTVCGATSKRFGLGAHTLDPKHAKKVYCTPEAHPVNSYENVTDWLRTAQDGPPVRKGLYQTTADPNSADVLWRMFDGQMRWGPVDRDYRRAVERATTESMLMTAPLYYRGLREDPSVQHSLETVAKNSPAPKAGDTWKLTDGSLQEFDGKAWHAKPKKARVHVLEIDEIRDHFTRPAQTELSLSRPRVRVID